MNKFKELRMIKFNNAMNSHTISQTQERMIM